MSNKKTVPIPVRLNDSTHTRIRRAAKKLGSTTSGVIRFAVLNQLPHIEAGRIVLEPDAKPNT